MAREAGKGSKPRPLSVSQDEFANSFDRIFGKKKTEGEKQMKAIVWSKNQCPFCDQAKNLLKMKGIEYEERNVSMDWTKEQLLEAIPTARTVPQIVLDGELVGGFNELKQRLTNAN
jgi:glutaredoxin